MKKAALKRGSLHDFLYHFYAIAKGITEFKALVMGNRHRIEYLDLMCYELLPLILNIRYLIRNMRLCG